MPRLLAPLALALALAGCGGVGASERRPVPGRTLTVYTSLPRHGDSAPRADAVAAGQRLALADARGRAGGYRVRLVELDSSDPSRGEWDPAVVEANADRAAGDPTTIAYLGELDLGGSAISVPVTNSRGVLQVSPLDGLTSLTRPQPGGARTAPERYYPSGRRTFLRLVPADLLEARVLLAWTRRLGGRRLAVAHDDRIYGRELAEQLTAEAGAGNVAIAAREQVRRGSPEGHRVVVRRLARARPDVVVYAGASGRAGRALLAAVARALPRAGLLGASGMTTAALPSGASSVDLHLTTAARPARTYPAAGRRVLRRLAAQLRHPMPVEALYGYESMRTVLDAVRRAAPRAGDRAAVVREALAPRIRRSVVGTYRLSPTGDVSETRFAVYRSEGGRLVFERLLDAAGRPRESS